MVKVLVIMALIDRVQSVLLEAGFVVHTEG